MPCSSTVSRFTDSPPSRAVGPDPSLLGADMTADRSPARRSDAAARADAILAQIDDADLDALAAAVARVLVSASRGAAEDADPVEPAS